MRSSASRVPLDRARSLLETVRGQSLSRQRRVEHSEQLAGWLLEAASALTTPQDTKHAAMLGRMMRDPRGQAFTTALTDRAFRSSDPDRIAGELAHLLTTLGLPRYFGPWERGQLVAGKLLAGVLPGMIARAMRARIREETRNVLLSAREADVSAHLVRRHREHVRVNVNQLGEALLGEKASEQRVESYVELAKRADIDALSVKVSSIGSQLNLLAFEDTAEILTARLHRIYTATLTRPESERPWVMLDMEAYRHAELTFTVMERALADPALNEVRAGIVLQAYLPDANAWQRELGNWARARVQQGAAPLRLRIVKGANLAHERVECRKQGVGLPMYERKLEVDANYKRILEHCIAPDVLEGIRLGVASHNLFDLAHALVLAHERGVADRVGLEMLEGMAEPLRRALGELGVDLLMYAPICDEQDLNTGIAYLVRRLDENTSNENFLSASFGMRPWDAAFERERLRFRAAFACMATLSEEPRKRREPSFDRELPLIAPSHDFQNEPDTDFSRPINRTWVSKGLAELQTAEPALLGSSVAGQRQLAGTRRPGFDPSRPEVVPYQIALASVETVERALACAAADPANFSRTVPAERAQLLRRVAHALRTARAELIAAMVLDGGKRVAEADAEVSEAIDFAEYYRASFLQLLRENPVDARPRGSVVVTPPWNFPLAIPAGGVLAALMAGNRVILKPALETALIAERLVRCMHEAGVPREALQLVLCEDEVGSKLITDPRVDSVILTGATDTARLFQRLRPGLRLLAETGGKNAYVVTAMSDRDQAIADVVHSAFGHAGQKCSAASLLILEAEVYDDPHFMATLADAVTSLHVGSAWDPRSFVTPLIREPEQALRRALNELEPGESWLIPPRPDPNNPRLIAPVVKLGVSPGSFTHTTELFGPVLAVMRARDLKHALELANATGYGLTAGIASLDEREQAEFVRTISAGNVYVNRTITGAIVQRQPFGGFGKSGFGPGAKAGGPNYVAQLCHLAPRQLPEQPFALSEEVASRISVFETLLAPSDARWLRAAVHDYARAFGQHFARAHDPQGILGQDNLFRYLPCPGVILRVEADAPLAQVAASTLAALIAGTSLRISVSPNFSFVLDAALCGHPLRTEEISELTGRNAARLRLLGTRTAAHDALCASDGTHLAAEPVLPLGRFELLHYLREQSVSVEYHRYGQLGLRGLQGQT